MKAIEGAVVLRADLELASPNISPDPGFCQELGEGIVLEDDEDMEIEEDDNADTMVPELEVSEVGEGQDEGEEPGLEVGPSGLGCEVDGARVAKNSRYDKNECWIRTVLEGVLEYSMEHSEANQQRWVKRMCSPERYFGIQKPSTIHKHTNIHTHTHTNTQTDTHTHTTKHTHKQIHIH